jgi:hypothetical protein
VPWLASCRCCKHRDGALLFFRELFAAALTTLEGG